MIHSKSLPSGYWIADEESRTITNGDTGEVANLTPEQTESIFRNLRESRDRELRVLQFLTEEREKGR